jgi:transcriptional regulator with XRE-family HTH domain
MRRAVMKRKDTVLDMARTGENLRNIMLSKGFTVKDVQEFLRLGSVQSIYRWFDGKSMPTIDNLYVLSDLFCMPVDAMLIGNRKYVYDFQDVLYFRVIDS